MINSNPLPAASGVGAGQTAVFDIPLGPTYTELQFGFSDPDAAGGFDPTDISEIRVSVNNVITQRFSAAFLQATNLFDKLNPSAWGDGSPTVYAKLGLTRNGLRTRQAQFETAFATGDGSIRTFRIEMDLASTWGNQLLEGHALSIAPRPVGAILFRAKETLSLIDGTKQFRAEIPRYMAINRIYLGSPNISRVRIVQNQVEIWNRSTAVNSWIQSSHGRREPQDATHYIFDTTEDGLGGQLLPIQGDTALEVTADTASNAEVIFEGIGTLGTIGAN